MKLTIHSLLYIIIACNFNTSITDRPVIKVIKEASHYAKIDGEKDREFILRNNVISIEKFDGNGVLLECQKFEMDGTLYEIEEYTLDNNLPTKCIIKSPKGKLKKYWLKKYDRKGNEIEFKLFDSINNIILSEYKKINSKDQIEEVNFKDVQFNLEKRVTCKYNSSNLLIEQKTTKNKFEKSETRTFQYNNQKQLVEEILTRETGEVVIFKSRYDEQNNLILHEWYDLNGIKIHENSFVFVYDNHKNWITKKRYQNGKIDYIWERDIIYY